MTKPSDVRSRARIAGLLYLVVIAGGLFAELFVRDRLTVAGDAAATARSILAHPLLFRAGFAAGLVILFCAVPIALLLYELLRPVDATLARIATAFNLVSISIEGVNLLHHYAPLVWLSGRGWLSAIPADQLHAMAYASLRLQSTGYAISLAFFAMFCIFTGINLARSTFFPRTIGALMVLAGAAYLVNSFALFLAPPLAARLMPWILLPPFVGEAALCGWLIVKGVDVAKWEAVAGEARGA